MEPPDPFPNSEVKRLSADGSVVRPCESRSSSAPYFKPLFAEAKGGFFGGWVLLLDSYQSLIEYYTNFFYNVRSFVRSFVRSDLIFILSYQLSLFFILRL